MSESCFMPDIKLLVPDEWPMLQDIRLMALKESPDAFLATYDSERGFDEARWRAEFSRGEWYIGLDRGRPVSLLGCTREGQTPPSECYLEYLWVSPEARHSNMAFYLLSNVVERLRGAGLRTAFLWVMDGNDAAMRLYRRVGFVSSNHRQPLVTRPGRTEELMQFDFA
jgi:ribosomal protein S18 acetylase RimI-like enzyme